MASFPTLQRRGTETHNPEVGGFETSMAQNPTIRGITEGGHVITRARFTRIIRKWEIKYTRMTKVNKNTVKAFEDACLGGSETFTWLNPEDSTNYTVRFLEPIIYTPHKDTNWLWWVVEFMLEEA